MEPTVESIYERLKQAQQETLVVLTIEGRPYNVEMDETSHPESFWQGRRDMDRFMDVGTWQTEGIGFQQLREWVEVHWSTEGEKQVPIGTVATGEDWALQRENQLDSVAATRKLITAAKFYGPEKVGDYAVEFAAHGMIEVRRVYLLKGPPIEATHSLDEYCTLLPYRDALRGIDAETDPTDFDIVWPEAHSGNVCALDGRYFESARPQGNEHSQYTSPFLKDGPEQLALLLGLVWGSGFRVFGNWRGVHPAAIAALPYRHATVRSGAGSVHVTLPLQGYGPPVYRRPLAVLELHELAAKFSELPECTRSRLAKAMELLRDSTERIKYEDRIIDVAAALSILYVEDEEQDEPAILIPQRAAWYYSDSENEKQQTEVMLGEFFARHSRVVRGRAFEEAGEEHLNRNAELLTDAVNVLRASLKIMIAEGRPKDWNQATKRSALRLDPPRAQSEIPSVKSDSLSWSVEEQNEIDRALEAVWRPIVEEAPPPPPHVGPSIVTGVLQECVRSCREQGTPYVIVHPARLYVAHPKWPRASSAPLDEHARYYCERDVGRHMRLWRDAAARKGLVRVEVPNDVEMYHPKCRDDWPRPLLSSHEDDSSSEHPSHQTVSGETLSSHDSMPPRDTDDRPRSGAEEISSDPPSALPESAVVGLAREWHLSWAAFQHDVNVATDSLFHLLDGIHVKHLAERQRLAQVMDASDGALKTLEDSMRAKGDDYPFSKYPKLRAFPEFRGEPMFMRTRPDGPMEQTVFKGWISEVWDLWESCYRTQLKHDNRRMPGAIRPRQQVLGDLRHIRNNLLHKGIAKRGEAANCETLRWFSEGERMHMRLQHIFDFLNQMGWLHDNPSIFIEGQGQASRWRIDREGDAEESTPALVSVRPFVDPQQKDPRYRYGASVAFENGVFGTTPMGPEREETEAQAKDRTRKWMKMTVNERGDLYVPHLGTVPAVKLYRDHLKGEKLPGPGIPGPWVQFRE